MSKNDAAVLLRAIQRKLGVRLTMRELPRPERVSQRQQDAEKAMRLIEAEMLASIARCEALEREL